MANQVANLSALPVKPQAELIYEQFRRSQRQFTLGVTASWVVLLALLALIFSGLHATVGPFTFTTIHLDLQFIRDWTPFISQGISQTILISLLSIFFATILALLAALGRLSRFPPIYAVSTFYISLIRGTPLFLQILFFFLALPQLGINLSGLSAGVFALSLNYGAYMSEIFRAGILSVSKGQRESAIALGMNYSQMMRRIILPQALRFAIPPTGNEFIAMLKDSALVSATGFVHEILWRAQKAGQPNFRNLEALIVAAVFYWGLTLIFSTLQSRLENFMARGDR